MVQLVIIVYLFLRLPVSIGIHYWIDIYLFKLWVFK